MSKFKPLSFDSTMPFGKYQGKSLRTLFTEDRGYLYWMSTSNINLAPNIHESLKEGKIVESTLEEELNNIYLAMRTKVRSVTKLNGYPRIELKYRMEPTPADFVSMDEDDTFTVEADENVMSLLTSI